MSEVTDGVLARLEKVEREYRMLKRCVAVVVLALGALFVMAQAPSRPRTVEAERLVIRYPNGKEAIVLDTSSRNGVAEGAGASFSSPAGDTLVDINASFVGGAVHVISPKGDLQVDIDASGTFPGFDFSKEPVGHRQDFL